MKPQLINICCFYELIYLLKTTMIALTDVYKKTIMHTVWPEKLVKSLLLEQSIFGDSNPGVRSIRFPGPLCSEAESFR